MSPPSDIQCMITEYVFTHVQVLALADHKPGEKKELDQPIRSELTVAQDDKTPGAFLCQLNVVFNPDRDPKYPYSIDISNSTVIHCSANGEVTVDEARDHAARLAHDILFPATREMVLGLTLRHAWGALHIGVAKLGEPLLAAPPVAGTPTKTPRLKRKRPASSPA